MSLSAPWDRTSDSGAGLANICKRTLRCIQADPTIVPVPMTLTRRQVALKRKVPTPVKRAQRLDTARNLSEVWIVLTPAERGGDMGQNRFDHVSTVFHAQLIRHG